MKSLRNKVIMSAIVLVFAVIATIGSTFAWFTISNVTTVSTMDIEVASSQSLLMRAWQTGEEEVEGQAYGVYGWNLDDFSSVVNLAVDAPSTYGATTPGGAYTTWRMLPVTALNGETADDTDYDHIDITKLRYLADNVVDERPLASASENTSSGHFLEFKFWMLRPGGTNTNVAFSQSLTGTATYIDAIHVGVLGDTSAAELSGNDVAFDAAGTITNGGSSDYSGYSEGDKIIVNGSTNNDGYFTVVSATATVITVEEAIITEAAGSNIVISTLNQSLFGDDLDYGYEWSAVDAGFDTDEATLNLVQNIAGNGGNGSVDTALANVTASSVVNVLETANVPEIVTVRVWLEGWDAQATNAVMGAQFTLSITFTLQA